MPSFIPLSVFLVLRGQPRFYCCQAYFSQARHAASRHNDDCRAKNAVWMPRLPLPANLIAALANMTYRMNLGKQYAGLSLKINVNRNELLCEYLIFCLLRGLVLVGANLLLYKTIGESLIKSHPEPDPIVNHCDPTNAILETHPRENACRPIYHPIVNRYALKMHALKSSE